MESLSPGVCNIGGDMTVKQEFTCIPNADGVFAWSTDIDELWLRIVSVSLYKAFQFHKNNILESNMEKENNFAAKMKFKVFKEILFSSSTKRFQEDVIKLYNESIRRLNGEPPLQMYVSYISKDKPDSHIIHAIIDSKTSTVTIGAKMSDEIIT